jgi:hypothetical protein
LPGGTAQEQRLIQYLRTQGYSHFVVPDEPVRNYLGLKPSDKCADVLAMRSATLLDRHLLIAESKGTNVAHALLQIGNAAAAALQKHGNTVQLKLLLFVPSFRRVPDGLSPGPGYIAKPAADGTLILYDATSSRLAQAKAPVRLGAPFSAWQAQVGALPVIVYAEAGVF